MRDRHDDSRPTPSVDSAAGSPGAPGAPGAPAQRTVPASLAVPWGLRQTAWGIALTVLPLGLLLVGAQLLPQPATPAATRPLAPAVDATSAVIIFIASAVVEAAFLIAPLVVALRARPAGTPRSEALRLLGLRRAALWHTLWLVAASYAAIFVFGLLYDLLHIPTNADTLARQAAHAPITTIATLLVAVTIAPFAEEVFFRGFVLPGLAGAMPLWAAIGLSALIFGLAHADLGSFLPLVAIGLALGVIRWRAGSTWPGIALHALNNGVATVIILATVFHR